MKYVLGETMAVKEEVSLPSQRTCTRCNFVSSQEVCKACVLLEGLNKGLPKLGIGKSSKAKRMIEEFNANQIKKESLGIAVSELDDSLSKQDVCNSNFKICNSASLCESKKNKLTKTTCNKQTIERGKCNSNCSKNCESIEVNSVDNSKVSMLLEKYEINEPAEIGNIHESGSGHISNSTKEDDLDNFSDEEEHQHVVEEDETCSSSCGRLGSLHIGF